MAELLDGNNNNEAKRFIQSMDDCISVLQGDLSQPGTPAIVLKLSSSWNKLKALFSSSLEKPNNDTVTKVIGQEETFVTGCSESDKITFSETPLVEEAKYNDKSQSTECTNPILSSDETHSHNSIPNSNNTSTSQEAAVWDFTSSGLLK